MFFPNRKKIAFRWMLIWGCSAFSVVCMGMVFSERGFTIASTFVGSCLLAFSMSYLYELGRLSERRLQVQLRMELAHKLADCRELALNVLTAISYSQKAVKSDDAGLVLMEWLESLEQVVNRLHVAVETAYPTAERPPRRKSLDKIIAAMKHAAGQRLMPDEQNPRMYTLGSPALVEKELWSVPLSRVTSGELQRMRDILIRLDEISTTMGLLVPPSILPALPILAGFPSEAKRPPPTKAAAPQVSAKLTLEAVDPMKMETFSDAPPADASQTPAPSEEPEIDPSSPS